MAKFHLWHTCNLFRSTIFCTQFSIHESFIFSSLSHFLKRVRWGLWYRSTTFVQLVCFLCSSCRPCKCDLNKHQTNDQTLHGVVPSFTKPHCAMAIMIKAGYHYEAFVGSTNDLPVPHSPSLLIT